MTEEQIDKRYIESINFPKYSLVDEESPRQDLTFRVLKIYLDSYGVYYNDENFTINNHLLTKDGKYNYQAFILSDQNDLSYKIAQWEGPTKRSKYVFKKEFGNGSVLKVIDDLNSYIKSTHNIVRSFFDSGNTARRDEYLIDQESFREGWINACLHNDYSKHLGPAVYLFNDHLEIFSYGNPLSVQTKEDFLRGISVPINPELTSVFMKIEKAEASGKGINTIVEKYGKEVFEFSETHFTIKIPYNKKVLETINSQEITQEITQENIQEKILKIIKEDPTVTRKILAIRLKTTPDSIKYYLDKMKKQGVIKHEGSTKSGYWEIIKIIDMNQRLRCTCRVSSFTGIKKPPIKVLKTALLLNIFGVGVFLFYS